MPSIFGMNFGRCKRLPYAENQQFAGGEGGGLGEQEILSVFDMAVWHEVTYNWWGDFSFVIMAKLPAKPSVRICS